jgi:hypothetical protein
VASHHPGFKASNKPEVVVDSTLASGNWQVVFIWIVEIGVWHQANATELHFALN